MFEVIISLVRTGKVERRTFETREDAENYLSWREEKFLTGRGSAKRSMRDIRLEVVRREPAAVAVPLRAAA
jgi:hypothetical protein